MEINTLEGVRLGGITHWIRIHGVDPSNPVLLLMQQGPGLPMINDRREFQRLLRLEDDFTVVYWDQRGTGLSAPSLHRTSNRFEISVARMVDDTVALLQLLRDRFGQKTVVAGFSFGATFAVYAAVRRPDLVAALVATGMDIDMPGAEKHAYDFTRDTARRRGNQRALRQLEAIGPPPHTTVKSFTTRARWVAEFGGLRTDENYHGLLRALLVSLVRSPDYSTADVVRALRGISASQAALLPSPPRTWFGTCRASTCPSSWHTAGTTRWHTATQHSGSTTRSRHRTRTSCGSSPPPTAPTSKNLPSSAICS